MGATLNQFNWKPRAQLQTNKTVLRSLASLRSQLKIHCGHLILQPRVTKKKVAINQHIFDASSARNTRHQAPKSSQRKKPHASPNTGTTTSQRNVVWAVCDEAPVGKGSAAQSPATVPEGGGRGEGPSQPAKQLYFIASGRPKRLPECLSPREGATPSTVPR